VFDDGWVNTDKNYKSLTETYFEFDLSTLSASLFLFFN
jgi:hypothetical protein